MDFQCPFCRKFAQILEEVLESGTADVRVVFHHLPLPGHAWARRAAEGVACAQLQGSEAFWALHNKMFLNQDSITADNIRTKLDEFTRDLKEVDGAKFQECVANSMSLGLVLKDLNLAEVNQVNGTPTLFINGHRVQGVQNASGLRTLIAEARKEAGVATPAAEQRAKPKPLSSGSGSAVTPAKNPHSP